MAITLTRAAKGTKLFGKTLLVSFFVLLLLKVSMDIYRVFFPKKTEVTIELPTLAFGQLPPLKIKGVSLPPNTKYTFYLDLITTVLPKTPSRVSVFPILKAPYGFLALDRANDLARRFNFFTKPQALTPTYYLWSAPNRKMETDTQSLNFNYKYSYLSDPLVFAPGKFISQEAGLQTAIGVVKSKGLLGGSGSYGGARGADLEKGEKKVRYLKYENGEMVSTTSVAQTSAIRVDLFRTPINDTPIVSPNHEESLINILISGLSDDSDRQRFTQILELNYTYWVINHKSDATYPVISPRVAWEKLQTKKEYFVYLGKNTKGNAIPAVNSFSAQEAYLAYYESAEYQPYLQPMWVFTGQATLSAGGQIKWVAYVPAIPDKWISQEQ